MDPRGLMPTVFMISKVIVIPTRIDVSGSTLFRQTSALCLSRTNRHFPYQRSRPITMTLAACSSPTVWAQYALEGSPIPIVSSTTFGNSKRRYRPHISKMFLQPSKCTMRSILCTVSRLRTMPITSIRYPASI